MSVSTAPPTAPPAPTVAPLASVPVQKRFNPDAFIIRLFRKLNDSTTDDVINATREAQSVKVEYWNADEKYKTIIYLTSRTRLSAYLRTLFYTQFGDMDPSYITAQFFSPGFPTMLTRLKELYSDADLRDSIYDMADMTENNWFRYD